MTDDFDFAIFPVEGMVSPSSCVKAFSDGWSTIPYIVNSKIRAQLGLTPNRLICLAVLRGNDYVNKQVPKFLRTWYGDNFLETSGEGAMELGEDSNEQERNGKKERMVLELVINFLPAVKDTEEALLAFCKEQLSPLTEEEVEERYRIVKRKYDIDSYPEFPLSLLTDDREKEQEVYEACGISRSRGQSNQLRIDDLRGLVECYRTTYSSFLIDFIFVPRICLPVTLFFQNHNRKNGAVS